jgi:ABC-type phosphate transport system substrate-binding protein
MFKTIRTLFVLLAIVSSTASNADLAIIAHPDYQGGELDEEAVRQLFLSERVSFPSGHKAEILNHAVGSQDRKYFFEYVLKMGETRHKRHWSRKKSAGKKGTPRELNSYEDVLNWVANTPLGITYVDKRMVNDSVKVLLTVDVFEDI